MPRKIVDGIEYLSATEAIKELGCSKQNFYQTVKPRLKPHRFDGRTNPMYNKNDIIAIATGKMPRKANIAITGMFSNWTDHARALGYNAETQRTEVTIGYLPADIANTFGLPTDELFVKRGSMTTVDGIPICSWDTYYPLKFVEDVLVQMREGTISDVLGHISQKHHVSVEKVRDRYSARVTTLDDINRFQLLNDEPVLILQRAATTKEQGTLVLFSDMVLLGSWFVIEREEDFNVKDLA